MKNVTFLERWHQKNAKLSGIYSWSQGNKEPAQKSAGWCIVLNVGVLGVLYPIHEAIRAISENKFYWFVY